MTLHILIRLSQNQKVMCCQHDQSEIQLTQIWIQIEKVLKFKTILNLAIKVPLFPKVTDKTSSKYKERNKFFMQTWHIDKGHQDSCLSRCSATMVTLGSTLDYKGLLHRRL